MTARTPVTMGKLVPAIAVVGMGVTCLGGFIAIRATQRDARKDGPSAPAVGTNAPSPIAPASGAPPIPFTAPVAAEPSARIVRTTEATTSIGGRFFLVEVENTGTLPLVRPSVLVSGFDTAGARVAEQPGYLAQSRLEPRASGVVLALISEPPAGAVRYEVRMGELRTDDYTGPDVAATVVESNERPSAGAMHDLVGTVRNDTASPMRFVHVVAVGRDPAGVAVSFADGYASITQLGPGESSGFRLSVGTFEQARPARWEIVSFGRP